jgi:hypothetical protein
VSTEMLVPLLVPFDRGGLGEDAFRPGSSALGCWALAVTLISSEDELAEGEGEKSEAAKASSAVGEFCSCD